MQNKIQLDNYKKLMTYINKYFKEDINIQRIEEICHYSYRNINRIFQAIHGETIGKYIKRIRLEKAAEYLKYSSSKIADIAFEIGFEDIASFSKAFKNRYHTTPSAFRKRSKTLQDLTRESLLVEKVERKKIAFEIEYLPDFEMLYLEHKGAYDNFSPLNDTWDQFLAYLKKKNLYSEQSILLGECLDDDEISDAIHCRYNLALILDRPLPFPLDGLFQTKTHQRQKYAKFLHKGSYETTPETYQRIYAFWMFDVNLELQDAPTLEFYLKDAATTPSEELLTEIYIPVQ
jgi:AraC family transcriptional regulator